MEGFSTSTSFLSFPLGNDLFGINVKYVLEVLGAEKITIVPKRPAHIKGVINFRGSILPVMDLRLKLNMASEEYTQDSVIIVLEFSLPGSSEKIQVGAVADAVRDVLDIKTAEISPVNTLDCKIDTHFCEGIYKTSTGFVTILDTVKVFI